jgi:hypothetical protein
MFVRKWQVSGNSEALSDRLAGSLNVQFLSTGTKSNCRDLFNLYSFASYCHSLAYALSLAFLSFPLSFCLGTTWFPSLSDTAWFSSSLVLLSHLSSWRFFSQLVVLL